jgi:hypothetical protein
LCLTGCRCVSGTRLFMRDRYSAENGLFCGFSPAVLTKICLKTLNCYSY